MPAYRRARLGLSRTFQVTNLFDTLSVGQNIRLAAQVNSHSRWRFWWPLRSNDATSMEARSWLEQVGLAHRWADRVNQLSHGEQRQLEIAMALATQPRLLLLDEPAAGLAGGERQALHGLLARRPRSHPMVLIEHDMSLVFGLADRVICMHQGRQIAAGPPETVRADPQVQAVYLGRAANA
jgi:branched-chain amino acid transport system ATP-binding protein